LGLTFAGLKFSVNFARPFCSLPKDLFATIVDTELERCLSGFPSAHTGLSILIAYWLWPTLGKLGKINMVLVVITVALSRITLAMHYPADILYSIIVTVIVIKISTYCFCLFEKSTIKPLGHLLMRLL
jgi:membrane-associated phospholipid phosphatase